MELITLILSEPIESLSKNNYNNRYLRNKVYEKTKIPESLFFSKIYNDLNILQSNY